jgi:hypothetical protein
LLKVTRASNSARYSDSVTSRILRHDRPTGEEVRGGW